MLQIDPYNPFLIDDKWDRPRTSLRREESEIKIQNVLPLNSSRTAGIIREDEGSLVGEQRLNIINEEVDTSNETIKRELQSASIKRLNKQKINEDIEKLINKKQFGSKENNKTEMHSELIDIIKTNT